MEKVNNETKKRNNKKLQFAVALSLTIGLAPFFPEPHIWGKLRWIGGGGVGMATMDYLDLLFHGAPWVYLIVLSIKGIRHRAK